MIRIEIIKDNNRIDKINFYGHANYDKYGKDIVCAAVSATMLCTVNAIFSIDEKAIDVISDKDLQTINILTDSDIVNKLIDNMIRCLKDLERQYPKNIQIQ